MTQNAFVWWTCKVDAVNSTFSNLFSFLVSFCSVFPNFCSVFLNFAQICSVSVFLNIRSIDFQTKFISIFWHDHTKHPHHPHLMYSFLSLNSIFLVFLLLVSLGTERNFSRFEWRIRANVLLIPIRHCHSLRCTHGLLAYVGSGGNGMNNTILYLIEGNVLLPLCTQTQCQEFSAWNLMYNRIPATIIYELYIKTNARKLSFVGENFLLFFQEKNFSW